MKIYACVNLGPEKNFPLIIEGDRVRRWQGDLHSSKWRVNGLQCDRSYSISEFKIAAKHLPALVREVVILHKHARLMGRRCKLTV